MSNPLRVSLALLIVLLGVDVGHSQWVQVNNGLDNLDVRAMAVIDSTIFVGTASGVFRSANGGANWSRTGLDTSRIDQLASDGENLLALSSGGLFLSTTKGGTWTNIRTSGWWANDHLSTIGVKKTTLLAGTWGNSVGGAVTIQRSTDFGVTWSQSSYPLPYFNFEGSVLRIITTGPELFLTTRDDNGIGDIYRSTDNGGSWLALPRFPAVGGGAPSVADLAIDGTTLFASLAYVGGGASLFRSTNNGVDWVETDSGLPNYLTSYSHIAIQGGSVFLNSSFYSSDSVYRSTNSGLTWTNVSTGLNGYRIRDVVIDGRAAYVATDSGGVYRYLLSTEGSLHITLYQEESYGLTGTSGKVRLYRGLDSLGEKHADANSVVQFDGLPAGPYLYEVYNTRITPWGDQYWGAKHVTVDAGSVTNDTQQHSTPYMPSARVYIDSTNELLAFGSRRQISPGTRLRVEVDVKNPNYPGSQADIFALSQIYLDRDMVPPYDIALSSSLYPYNVNTLHTTKIYPVLDHGGSYYLSCAANWISMGITDAGGWFDPAFTVVEAPAVPILASPADRSANQPASLTFSWRSVGGALAYHLQLASDSTFTSGILVNDSTIVDTSRASGPLSNSTTYYWRVRAETSDGMGDFSLPWRFRTLLPLPIQVQLTSPVSGTSANVSTVGFVWRKASPEVTRYWFEMASDSQFVFKTLDSTLADTFYVRQNLINGTYWWRVKAYNASGWGAFSESRRLSVVTTGLSDLNDIPTEYVLDQNYPNPFNPSTVLRFGLASASHVTLIVYNALGQEIRMLVNEALDAGYHLIRVDGEGLPSGVYFCRMTAGDFVATIALHLVK